MTQTNRILAAQDGEMVFFGGPSVSPSKVLLSLHGSILTVRKAQFECSQLVEKLDVPAECVRLKRIRYTSFSDIAYHLVIAVVGLMGAGILWCALLRCGMPEHGFGIYAGCAVMLFATCVAREMWPRQMVCITAEVSDGYLCEVREIQFRMPRNRKRRAAAEALVESVRAARNRPCAPLQNGVATLMPVKQSQSKWQAWRTKIVQAGIIMAWVVLSIDHFFQARHGYGIAMAVIAVSGAVGFMWQPKERTDGWKQSIVRAFSRAQWERVLLEIDTVEADHPEETEWFVAMRFHALRQLGRFEEVLKLLARGWRGMDENVSQRWRAFIETAQVIERRKRADGEGMA